MLSILLGGYGGFMNLENNNLSDIHKDSKILDISDFYLRARNILDSCKENEYALISVDIDNFKYINDLFGYHTGDSVLNTLEITFVKLLKENEFISRLNSDIFLFFINNQEHDELESKIKLIINSKESITRVLSEYYNLTFSIGLLRIENPKERLNIMVDNVNYARKCAKTNHNSLYIEYDATIDSELKWKREVTTSMQAALINKEFVVYLQPKVLMKTSEIVGAEALVRWNSPKYGLLAPIKFIPIFEQNGFINLLDFYILEQCCIFLKKCIDEQLMAPIPISVNFSRMHIGTVNISKKINDVVEKYGVPSEFIEIELTENVLLQDLKGVIELTDSLKRLGFRVSIDDFGSEYSSLSCLKDLSVDIVKIDKGFLKESANTEKGKLILSRVVEMIKCSRMVTVMEGIETEEQVEFLRRLNCDIAQGYYYSKPMPIEDFIDFSKIYNSACKCAITDESEINTYAEAMPHEFKMDNWELYLMNKNIGIGIMKGYLDEDTTIQYANKQALDYIGYSYHEFKNKLHSKIIGFTHPDDVEIVRENAKRLVDSEKSIKFKTRAIKNDGSVVWLEGNAMCIMDHNQRFIGVYAFQDVTNNVRETEMLIEEIASLKTENKMLKNQLLAIGS